MIDYYQVLGLNSNASIDDIKKAARSLMLKYHPDKNKNSGATEKFIDVVEAYELLSREKGEESKATDLLLIRGTITIQKRHDTELVEVIQGDTSFYGTLNASPNNQYLIVFHDGYGYYDKWINGKLLLIEKNELLWFREFERPINAAVSDDGRIALLYTANRDSAAHSSTPKEFTDLGCNLTVIEKTGVEIFSYEFGSNADACDISSDGELIVVSTFRPDNTIYCFDMKYLSTRDLKLGDPMKPKKGFWKYKNHSRKVVVRLQIIQNIIEVFTGHTISSFEKEYALYTNGTLLPEYAKEVENISKLKGQKPELKVQSLVTMINYRERKKRVEGLHQLARFVTTKGSMPYYEKIAEAVQKHIQSNDTEVFDILWKVIKVIAKTQPHLLDPYIADIIERVKKSGKYDEDYLFHVGELGRANPKWIVNEIPIVRQKLYSQKWNERRFAAFAIAAVGSKDVTMIEDAIPQLVEYATNPDKVRVEMGGHLVEGQVVYTISEGITETISIEMDRATMIRDACIDALGEIGRNFPKSVEHTIPLLENISKTAPSPFTVKKALRAIQSISGKYEGSFRHLI
jgi:DnaJ domain